MSTALALLLLIHLSAGSMAPAQKTAGGIEWAPDLKAAMAQSAGNGRPVIAYFTYDG